MYTYEDKKLTRRGDGQPSLRYLNAGQVVFREGEMGDQAFIVQRGSVRIYKTHDGETVDLGVLRPGALFGEMSILDRMPRMASARATEPTTLLVISRDLLERKLGATDPFVRGLIAILSQNVRAMGEQLIVDAAA